MYIHIDFQHELMDSDNTMSTPFPPKKISRPRPCTSFIILKSIVFQNLDNVCQNEMAMLKISALHAEKILETQPLETFWIRSTFTIKHILKTDIACLKSCWEKKRKNNTCRWTSIFNPQ